MADDKMADGVMVLVRDGYKMYGSYSSLLRKISSADPPHLVLAGINLTVAKGTIYTLLGPSGCGKTTLLSCIVGMRTLNAGTIKLGIKSLSQIGYMPQEVGLQGTLSVEENISFYANLFNLSEDHMDQMRRELYTFLQLPSEKMLVKHLSGGQQRRLSLYITLLHDPDLLILDEPTVGLDPAISHRIWEYFLHLANEKKRTIIITTHYIEEARKAHRIGMMRKGTILEEGNPQELMNKNGVETLDDLFLKLSMKQIDATPTVIQGSLKASDRVEPPIKSNSGFSFDHCKTQFLQDIIWSKRNKELFVILLLLPIINCFIYSSVIGKFPEVTNVGMVNDELSNNNELCKNWGYTTCDVHNISDPLSCGYKNEIEKLKIKIISYSNLGDAQAALFQSDIIGYIHIPLNFTKATLYRSEMGSLTDDDDINMSEIAVQMDMTSKFFSNNIKDNMRKAYLAFLEKLYESCNWPVASVGIPIKLVEPFYGEDNITFTEFTLPSIVELSAYFLPFLHIVGIISSEKVDCVWNRFLVSGMTFAEVLTGHFFLTICTLILQITLMVSVLFGYLNSVLNGSLLLYCALTFVVGLGGLSFGTFTAISCEQENAATIVGLGSFFPFTLVSGMVWPYEGMSYYLQLVCKYMPLTLTTDSYRAISIKGWGITNPTVYNGFLISCFWIAFYCCGSYGMLMAKKLS